MTKQEIQQLIDNGLHEKFVSYLNTQEIQGFSYAYCIQTDSFVNPNISYSDYCQYDYVAIAIYGNSIGYAVPFESYIPIMGKASSANSISIPYERDSSYKRCNCCHNYARVVYKVTGAEFAVCGNCKANWKKVLKVI